MELKIPRDYFDNPVQPEIYLCTTGKKIISELPVYDVSLVAKWNAYSELTFSIDRTYVDVLTGDTKVHPAFDKVEGLRMIYVKGIGYFLIQDPDFTSSDKDTKTISCFSSEYTTGAKYLEEFRINTGDVDAKEVIYAEANSLGEYDPNKPYETASKYDAYTRYYEYDEAEKTYIETQVVDENDYNNKKDKLFVRSYKNVQFYNASIPELSLLHLIFEKIPEWSIGDVDVALWRKERKFDESRIAVYDFLMNNLSSTFNCVVEWDTMRNRVNFYEEAEDGIEKDNSVQSRFDTDIFISKDNLANEINIKYSTDDIKTKLKVSGSDGLDIREVNFDNNYIINLDYFLENEWMEQDLIDQYQAHLDALDANAADYNKAVADWVKASQEYNTAMYAVPADAGVVQVGDVFEKLYCLYTPIDNAYLEKTLTDDDIDQKFDKLYEDKECKQEIDKTKLKDTATFCVQGYRFIYVKDDNEFKCMGSMLEYNQQILVGDGTKPGKLELYHVDEDTNHSKTDNILLRLRASQSKTAEIRIWYDNTAKAYKIYRKITDSNNSDNNAENNYDIALWLQGKLTATELGLVENGEPNYTITYIGTMGAYFVLAKDETQEANLQEYGVMLLQEKKDTYDTILNAQAEKGFSDEKYKCTVSNVEPESPAIGDKWMDTSGASVVMKECSGVIEGKVSWTTIETNLAAGDQANYENYQRYIDNYNKKIAVESVLAQKKMEAEYWLNGHPVSGTSITLTGYYYNDGIKDFTTGSATLREAMINAAQTYFPDVDLTSQDANYNANIPLYTFSYDKKDYAIYLQGNQPYVAYAISQGVCQTIRNHISTITAFESFFDKQQWIRLSPFIREDEFTDDNFFLTGYESEEERLAIGTELMESATKQLKTLSQPSLEFSMNMANLLAIPEFEPLFDQFKLGNFVRVYIREEYVKRARLLEVSINFNDLSDFNCTFGNLITTRSEVDNFADLMAQAVTAGKTVAASKGEWQMAKDKANKIEEAIAEGLSGVTINVGKDNGQAVSLGPTGFYARKYKDGYNANSPNPQYEDEQIAIINNKLLFTTDNFKTAKSAFGSFTYDGQTYSGLLAEAVIGGLVRGAKIEGGSLEIGTGNTVFRVSEDGSVSIMDKGAEKYAQQVDLKDLERQMAFSTHIECSDLTVFSSEDDECQLTCKVYQGNEDITAKLPTDTKYSWIRLPKNDTLNAEWNNKYKDQPTNVITISHYDVDRNAQFICEVQFDPDKIIKN